MSTRTDRINDLESITKQYVQAEKDRLDAEVQVLKAILDARPGGKGISAVTIKVVSEVANNDLSAFLGAE
jgi:hypothetical protein